MGGGSFGGKDPQWIVKPEKKKLANDQILI
jgi:hypothetical protein